MVLTDDDRRFLTRAVELAEAALEAGDEPFGSVLVSADGEVLMEDHNHVAGGDHTQHPEFAIARWAANHLTPDERAVATVYTSGEHCPMCAAAHGWVGLGRIVYASSSEQLTGWLAEFGVPAGPVAPLPIQDVVPGATVEGPDDELAERIRGLHRRRSEAVIGDDRRQRVEGLFAILASVEIPELELPEVARAAAESIDGDALARHVETLAREPRHALANVGECRAAGAYVAEQLWATGLAVAEYPASVDGVTHPAYAVTVPGAQPGDRAAVLVAHYDSVEGSPGADDNASGVAAALEIARVLPRGELPIDVVVAVVPFEESPGGFAGSRAVAQAMHDEGRQVVAAVSAEMVGFATDEPRVAGDRGDDLLLVGYPGTDEVVATLIGAANALHPGSMRGLALPEVLPEVQRSDHAAFHEFGWPAVMATDGAEFRNPHYHQPGDTPATIDAGFHLRSTQALAAGLIALAAADPQG